MRLSHSLRVSAGSIDDDKSCGICYVGPRAVRNLPCGHGGICELCTIKSMQADGFITCGICRTAVSKLVVVPLAPASNPPLVTRMQTYQAEPEPGGSAFESVDSFLQAKIMSDDAEVAEAARAALARVSGQGKGPRFPIDAQGHATVPEGVTELPDQAFFYCTSLISITLPASLTRIGSDAFYCCFSLALTSLPDGLTSTGNQAFGGCASLALTSLPDGLTSIGDHTFCRCTSLALTSLPDGLTSIGSSAFWGCASLALTSLPEGLTTISSSAFQGCMSLALTSLPRGLTSIGDQAFFVCTSLALTSLPDGLTSVGDHAFCGCTSLALTSLPDGLTSIGDGAFRGCTSLGPHVFGRVLRTSTLSGWGDSYCMCHCQIG